MRTLTKQKTIKLCISFALYVCLCLVFAPINFGDIQFRISELLCLLAIENPLYILSLTLGCFVVNALFSPFGIVDAIVGSFATLLGCYLGYKLKNIKYKNFPLLSALIISISNSIIVSLEINILFNTIYLFTYSVLKIFISEVIILVIIGYPIYNKLLKIERGKEK